MILLDRMSYQELQAFAAEESQDLAHAEARRKLRRLERLKAEGEQAAARQPRVKAKKKRKKRTKTSSPTKLRGLDPSLVLRATRNKAAKIHSSSGGGVNAGFPPPSKSDYLKPWSDEYDMPEVDLE